MIARSKLGNYTQICCVGKWEVAVLRNPSCMITRQWIMVNTSCVHKCVYAVW